MDKRPWFLARRAEPSSDSFPKWALDGVALTNGDVAKPFGESVDELGKRDPQGYFVILAKKDSKEILPKEAIVEEEGELVIIRVKSRSIAKKIFKKLKEKGLLASP